MYVVAFQVHTNKKRHSCSQCSKQFHRKTHLLAHMRRHSANPEFKPRASRKKLNPYIQFQKKKEASRQQWEEAEVSIPWDPSIETRFLSDNRNQQLWCEFPRVRTGILFQHGANTHEPVVTEEELEELRRQQAEMVEEEVTRSFPFKGGILVDEEDEDDEELDEC